ncbi:MAG: hypothetical protein CMH83_08600 [Nocardioides sp.]|nr:hypothetical protein [Nocardioides sp.]
MSDQPPGAGPAPGSPDQEPVGSVGEEAAKLFGALADWARDQGDGLGAGLADGVGHLADTAARTAKEVDDHLATGAAECRYCPICRTVHVIRETSPEIRAHLATAASSLLQAVAGILETVPPPGSGAGARDQGGLQHIDLDGDDADQEDDGEEDW